MDPDNLAVRLTWHRAATAGRLTSIAIVLAHVHFTPRDAMRLIAAPLPLVTWDTALTGQNAQKDITWRPTPRHHSASLSLKIPA